MRAFFAGVASWALLAACANAQSVTGVPFSSSVTPVVTASSAYVSGYNAGGPLSFTVPPGGLLTNGQVVFNSGSFSGSVDVVFLSALPTGGGTTDHAALALTSTDTGKVLGTWHLTDCTTLNSGSIVQCQVAQAQTFKLGVGQGTTLYAVTKVNGTPTFTGTGDMTLTIFGQQ